MEGSGFPMNEGKIERSRKAVSQKVVLPNVFGDGRSTIFPFLRPIFRVPNGVTIVVAYLMKTRRTSLSQALEHVKSRRPVASPNSGFIRQLEDFEKSLQGSWGKRKIGEGSGQSKRQKLMPASKIIAGASKERAAAALSEMKGYSVDSVLNELLELEEVMRTFEAVV